MRTLASCALLGAALTVAPTPGVAQTHPGHHPPAPAPPPAGSPAGAGDAPSHGTHQAGESPAEMLWSMYTDLGNRAYQHGLYGEAEKTFKSAVKEARTFGPGDRRLALSLNNLAETHRMQGRFVEAEQSAREALALREAAFGPNDASVADSLNTLALSRHAQGHPGEAVALYQRALGIWEPTLGASHARVAVVLNNLAMAQRDQGQLDAAEATLRRSIAIREAIHGPDHVDVALGLAALAELERARGRYADSVATGLRGVAIIEAREGPEHPGVALILGEVAESYRAEGRPDQAEPLYRRALAIWERSAGWNHPRVVTTLGSLAEVRQARGDAIEAERLLSRAIGIVEGSPQLPRPARARSRPSSSRSSPERIGPRVARRRPMRRRRGPRRSARHPSGLFAPPRRPAARPESRLPGSGPIQVSSGCGREQRRDERAPLGVPFAVPYGACHELAPAVDEDHGRGGSHPIRRGDRATLVEEHREREAARPHPRGHLGAGLAEVDREDREAPVAELPVQGFDRRGQLPRAVRSPGRPEVEHRDTAALAPEGDQLALEIGQRDRRRLARQDPRAEIAQERVEGFCRRRDAAGQAQEGQGETDGPPSRPSGLGSHAALKGAPVAAEQRTT